MAINIFGFIVWLDLAEENSTRKTTPNQLEGCPPSAEVCDAEYIEIERAPVDNGVLTGNLTPEHEEIVHRGDCGNAEDVQANRSPTSASEQDAEDRRTPL